MPNTVGDTMELRGILHRVIEVLPTGSCILLPVEAEPAPQEAPAAEPAKAAKAPAKAAARPAAKAAARPAAKAAAKK